ncbi:DUF2500 domain-containing protein [Sporosarcina sp. Marseille-Q4063]|uniref:DUF2500 domain-containing protein n=1 Tax=Sporosarcina sp. Marseille-Q4063 TaxID=2810514 RepID=UPI0020160C8E|nr:DUF2500 domain-containing protein [Sporosarcina sp. Marseille-Q4063]
MFFEPGSFVDTMFMIGIFIVIVFIIIKGATEWSSNNNSPKLTVPAKVVTKRTSTSGGAHHSTDHMHSMTTTSYYVTFQFESGDRSEFSLNGSQFGMLAEQILGCSLSKAHAI